MIRIHNSLTGEKQTLTPIVPGELRMYVCGLTVYDYVHIGHARMLTVFDVVSRYLRHRGYRLTYVRNITDIDDKIIQRAAQNGEAIEALTARFIDAMNEDCAQLGIARPDHEPRATQYLPQIIAIVGQLLAKDYAYVTYHGDVMYAVARFAGYGRLSGKRLADLRAGARVEVDESSAIRSTSCCGNMPSPGNRRGTRRGARADRGGTSSARPCPPHSSARISTCTAEGSTSSSRIMRTRSRSRVPRAGTGS